MKKIIFPALVLIFVVFRAWFIFQPLSSGDWSFNFIEGLREIDVYPFVWNSKYNFGMGESIAFILSLETYFLSAVHLLNSIFRLPWEIIERIISFWPFLIVSVFSSAYLFRKMLPQNKFWIFSTLIFLFNSYALVLVGGGQMGVAMGYALAPLVLYVFVNDLDLRLKTYDLRKWEKSHLISYILNLKSLLVAGLTLALQVMFDARIAYITMMAIGVYDIIQLLTGLRVNGFKERIVQVLSGLTIPVLIAVLLHFFWLIPLLLYRQNPYELLGSAYNSIAAVKFFSFADFSHALSLLHPNWPENIFGKTYFLQPEFLGLPILAFSSLLFINGLTSSRVKKLVLFFSLLGLMGAFLAKGANEPFGGIYLWLFEHIPGFVMFRDPTKWFTLVALSYCVLIPFSLSAMYEKCIQINKFLISNFKFLMNFKFLNNKLLNIQNIFLLLVTSYLLLVIKPAILGQLGGTFRPGIVPTEYVQLKDYLYNQKDFFRTFWVPSVQRFGFYTNNHPAIGGQGFFKVNSSEEVVKELHKLGAQSILEESAVKYLIVPFDSTGELFLTERKYDDTRYQKIVSDIAKIPWLTRVAGFGKIAVFETAGYKAHFFINGFTGSRVNGLMINPTKYGINVENVKKGDLLVFSEGFDGGWVLNIPNSKLKIQSSKFRNLFNSFVLPKDGTYQAEIFYEPQKYVDAAIMLSLATLILCLLYLIYYGFSQKNSR